MQQNNKGKTNLTRTKRNLLCHNQHYQTSSLNGKETINL